MFLKCQKRNCEMRLGFLWLFMILVVISVTAIKSNAYYEDFEDGDYDGWLTNGSGAFNVVFYNGSNMARAKQTSIGSSGFSHDFTYVNGNILSFDMQANGLARIDYASYVAHAGGYVNVSFLNNFNVSIGSASLQYSTNSGSIDPAYRIDSDMHHYTASMSEWAALAGLDNTENISTLKLSFTAWGQRTAEAHYQSIGTIWFDNVQVLTPEPATVSLLGLGGLLFCRRKHI